MIEQIEYFPTQQLAKERAEQLKWLGYVAYVEVRFYYGMETKWQVRYWKDYGGAFSGPFPDHVLGRIGE